MNEFQIAVQQTAGTLNRDIIDVIACAVKSVDIDTRTCTVTPIEGDAETEIAGVMIMAEVSDGIFPSPKVGSTVIVGVSTKKKALILMYSEVEMLVLLGGELGGIPKVIPLTEKLNNLEAKVNEAIGIFNSHTHIITAPSTPSGPPVPLIVGTLTPTLKGEIENVKITHGE